MANRLIWQTDYGKSVHGETTYSLSKQCKFIPLLVVPKQTILLVYFHGNLAIISAHMRIGLFYGNFCVYTALFIELQKWCNESRHQLWCVMHSKIDSSTMNIISWPWRSFEEEVPVKHKHECLILVYFIWLIKTFWNSLVESSSYWRFRKWIYFFEKSFKLDWVEHNTLHVQKKLLKESYFLLK